MEGDEVGIFSKAAEWKSLFLLKIEIKHNQRFPNNNFNAIFERVHPIIKAYPRNKKIFINQ